MGIYEVMRKFTIYIKKLILIYCNYKVSEIIHYMGYETVSTPFYPIDS